MKTILESSLTRSPLEKRFCISWGAIGRVKWVDICMGTQTCCEVNRNHVGSAHASLSLAESVCLTEDVEMKPEMVMMSPPASDSGSGSPHQFSPYCIDSEPASPLLEHEQVRNREPASRQRQTRCNIQRTLRTRTHLACICYADTRYAHADLQSGQTQVLS